MPEFLAHGWGVSACAALCVLAKVILSRTRPAEIFCNAIAQLQGVGLLKRTSAVRSQVIYRAKL